MITMKIYVFRPFCFTIRRMILKDNSRLKGQSMVDTPASELDYALRRKYKGTRYEDKHKQQS